MARANRRWAVLLFLALVLPLVACQDRQAERMVLKADDEWIKGRNQTAIEILKSVLETHPSGLIAEKAIYRLGEIHYFSLKNSAKALFYFQELHRVNRASPLSYNAQKYIAEIAEFSIQDLDQAIIEYQKLIDDFNNAKENPDHQFRIASIYFKKRDIEQARVELEILLENYPDSAWAEESIMKVTHILFTQDRCPEARARYSGFVQKFSKSKFRSEMDFIMASCDEEEGAYDKALEGFKALENKYPYPALLRMKVEGIQKRITEIKGNPSPPKKSRRSRG